MISDSFLAKITDNETFDGCTVVVNVKHPFTVR